MKDYENQIGTTKRETPKRRIFANVFEENSMMMLQDEKGTLPECLYLLSFLKDFDDNKGRREMTEFDNVNISKDV